jgi:bcr-type benzoyl-CoA reductase subunit C
MLDSQTDGGGGSGQALEVLIDAARAPLADWPTRYPDRQVMGYLCSYVPGEMIHAAGLTPVRVRGNSDSLRRVDAHLQSFTCALCRSTLDQALGGRLEFLAGTVFAHTCDAMQVLADLWRMSSDATHFVDTIMQPANLGSPAARVYLVAELTRFQDRLAAFVGRRITESDLRASVDLYDETRQMVQTFHLLRDRLSTWQFFAILDAAQVMPREVYNALLTELLATLGSQPAHSAGPRLFLAGAVLDEPRLLNLIDSLGGQVVGDDLCTGLRHFEGQVGEGNPVLALAEYYLRRSPCPSKFHPLHSPGRHLLDQVRQVQAQGVVFVLEKFCEPHAFEYALVLSALDRAGVPYLLLEMEQTPGLEALRTRLQAFLETL